MTQSNSEIGKPAVLHMPPHRRSSGSLVFNPARRRDVGRPAGLETGDTLGLKMFGNLPNETALEAFS
jgi:hypothetical protein